MFTTRPEYEGIPCEGNHCFEGYAYDLIDAISNILGFKYEFRLVAGNKYGAYNKETRKWDGLVKELLDHVRKLQSFRLNEIKLIIIFFPELVRMLIWRYVI